MGVFGVTLRVKLIGGGQYKAYTMKFMVEENTGGKIEINTKSL